MQKSLRALLVLLLAAVLLPPAAPLPAQAAGEAVSVWRTTADQSELLQPQIPLAFGSDTTAGTLLEVNEQATYQQIDGFGGAMTDSSAWLLHEKLTPAERDTVMRKLFDPVDGIGMSYLRLPMGTSDFASNDRHYTYNDMPPGQTDPTLANFSVISDTAWIIPMLQQARAINPKLKIMGSPWSAPAWMKTTGSLIKGRLKPEHYAAYANYFVKFVEAYEGAPHNIPIDAITIQNEPQYEPENYPGMWMSPADQASFVKDHLGPAFASNGIDTKIVAFDHNWSLLYYGVDVLNDAAARPYIDGIAYHCYGGIPGYQQVTHDAYPDKNIYFTECTSGAWSNNWAGDFAWDLQNLVIGTTRNWARTVIKWNLALDTNYGPHKGGCGNCTGFVAVDQATGTVARYNHDYYAIGHASKFVTPGAYRIASTDLASAMLDNVAFKNPDGSKALIVLNRASAGQTFSVRWGGQSFSYTLPAGAAATFTWSGSQASPSAPAAPANLAAKAGNARITLTWDISALASSYSLKRATTPGGPYTTLATGLTQAQYTDTAVVNGTTYYYIVSGSNAIGDGMESAEVRATPNVPPPLQALSRIEAESFDREYGIGLENCNDTSGCGQNIANTEQEDYLGWDRVDFGTGVGFVQARIASNSTGGSIEFRLNSPDGPLISTVPVAMTCGWQSWVTVAAPVSGATGIQTLYAVFKGTPPKDGITNFNWFQFAQRGLGRLDRATWSATASSSAGADLPANALADNNCTNRWSSGQAQTPGQFFLVDLGTTQTFDRISLDAGGNDYPRGYRVEVSPDGSAWTEVASGTGRSSSVVAAFAETQARYIRVSLTASTGSWWSIAQFNVDYTGAPPPAGEGALDRAGWAVSASSVPSDPCCTGDLATQAIDGDEGTRWTSGQAQAPGQFFLVDMGAPALFDRLTVLSAGGDHARSYELYVSNDGERWGTAVITGTGSAALTEMRFPIQLARYFKLVQTASSGSWWSIHELNAYLSPGLDRSAWEASASSVPSDPCCTGDLAARAIDGDEGTRWTSGQSQTPGQFFLVDMGTERSLNQLVLDSGTGGDYGRSYALYLSSDGVSWGAAVITGTGEPLTLVSFPTRKARYFKLVQTGSSGSWWSIHELNAYESHGLPAVAPPAGTRLYLPGVVR